ncbi:hypothetical protein BANRA_05284 [Klebsiella pneumoniae]|nr:Uncharacterised protein [Klebsiella pneumoniae]VCY07986.1 hypothetical protein BANRA_05284 [Klebsiella pneumoniae]
MRMGLGIDLGIFTSLAAEGNDDIAVVIGDLCQNSLTTESRIRQRLGRHFSGVGLNCCQHAQQRLTVRGAVGQLRRHDDLVLGIDRCVPVVALLGATTGVFHDPAVRIGEAFLITVIRHTKLAFVRATALVRAIRMARPAAIVFAAPPGLVRFTLARFQARLCRLDRLQALLAARNLGRNVQLRLVTLLVVGSLGAIKQRLDLAMQFVLGRLHALIAHRLVAAGVGFYLGAVDRDRAKLHQPTFARQLHHLNEQILKLGQV